MKTTRLPAAIATVALSLPLALHAQTTAPAGGTPAAAPMADAASGAKTKKAPRARVTGGPGYVSEAGAPASAASAGSTKHRARVTGGPGGTAPSPKSGS